jgi:pimeloyl-ACP methyl ester carboxylesterase
MAMWTMHRFDAAPCQWFSPGGVAGRHRDVAMSLIGGDELWHTLAPALPTVADAVIEAIFPWCFTPEMYVDRPEFVDTLADFVRGRPAQPLDAFLAQTEAAMAHDASAVLGEIGAPTLITVGARDLVCSPRFAEPLTSGIGGSELVVFEHLSHAGLHEDPETFNRVTLDFLLRQRS